MSALVAFEGPLPFADVFHGWPLIRRVQLNLHCHESPSGRSVKKCLNILRLYLYLLKKSDITNYKNISKMVIKMVYRESWTITELTKN